MTAEVTNNERHAGRWQGRRTSRRQTLSAIRGDAAEAVASFASRRGALLTVAVCCFLVAAGAGPWREVVDDFFGRTHPFWVREDFSAFYAAGHVVATGLGAHLYDPGTMRAAEYAAAGRQVGGSGLLMYFNPPFFALLYWPLTNVSLQHAYQLWTVLNAALLVLNCWLLIRLTPALPRRWRLVLVIGYLTLYPLTFGLRLGQFSLILQASWAAGALLLEQHRDRSAGLAFSLLLIKPELLIPAGLFLVLKRRWQSFITLVPVALAAVALSIAVVGLPGALHYPGFVLGSTASNGSGVAPNLMIDYSGTIAAAFGHGASVTRPLASAALALLSLGAVAYLAGPPGRSRSAALAPAEVATRFRGEWLALSLAAVLCDPHMYLQDTVIVVPAAVAFLASLEGPARIQFAFVLLLGWGVERVALYPNQHLHLDLFAVFLTAMFVVLLAKTLRAPFADAPRLFARARPSGAHSPTRHVTDRPREPHAPAEVGGEGGGG